MQRERRLYRELFRIQERREIDDGCLIPCAYFLFIPGEGRARQSGTTQIDEMPGVQTVALERRGGHLLRRGSRFAGGVVEHDDASARIVNFREVPRCEVVSDGNRFGRHIGDRFAFRGDDRGDDLDDVIGIIFVSSEHLRVHRRRNAHFSSHIVIHVHGEAHGGPSIAGGNLPR